MILFNNKGSLLIEILVSITLAMVFSLAIGTLLMSNDQLVTAAELKTRATALAKESMEQVFAVKQAGWQNLGDLPEGYYIIQINDTGDAFELIPSDSQGEMIDNYRRTINITKEYRIDGRLSDTGQEGDKDEKVRRIEVKVFWEERDSDQEISLVSYVTHWKTE